MPQNFNCETLKKVSFLVGNEETLLNMLSTPAKQPFSEDIAQFLNEVSKTIMNNPASKAYSDVITFAFWIRKGSIKQIKEKLIPKDGNIRLGRGIAFHIAPSNVPVNFAYSLVTGLLTGNANIVRIPSKDFPQVKIITDSINKVLETNETMKPYIVLVRYERDKEINDCFSSIADTRIIWGGDNTIAELRKSELPPRSSEITFADRYSLAIIDSDEYIKTENKDRIVQDFYNDTYFTDQNACTSPRIVIWTGKEKQKAQNIFWEKLHKLVKEKYTFQPVHGINKLTSSFLTAVNFPNSKIEAHEDNLIVRIKLSELTDNIMDFKDNCGYFFEFDCNNIMELKPICDNKRCQTIGIYGDKNILKPLILSGIKGVDRVVPIGKTMDFELIWDGYDLISMLTRIVKL